MSFHRHYLASMALGAMLAACGEPADPATTGAGSAYGVPAEASAVPAQARATAAAARLEAEYDFLVPASFNGGIFGVDIENRVSVNARLSANGEISGRYHYRQSVEGEDFIFAGNVTCFQVYDTPVLQRFPGIPAMTANRAKWGGLIVESNDPTLPAGGYIWFQSIDNGSFTDVSTLSGFGDEAANEAFCASANVPNANFGPHALRRGDIRVQ